MLLEISSYCNVLKKVSENCIFFFPVKYLELATVKIREVDSESDPVLLLPWIILAFSLSAISF